LNADLDYAGNINFQNGRLFIKSDGNVGIGTTSPQKKLHVKTTGDWAAFFGNDTAAPRAGIWVGGSGTAADPYRAVFGAYDSNTQVRLNVGGSDYLTVATNGNVGIGTTSPGEKLTVTGGRIGQLESGTYGDCWGKWAAIGVPNLGCNPTNLNYYGLKLQWDSDAVVFGLKDYGSNRKDAIISWGDDSNDNLRFLSPVDTDAMIITGTGNVGIGTTDPGTNKLKVAGNTELTGDLFINSDTGAALTVKGSIHVGTGSAWARGFEFDAPYLGVTPQYQGGMSWYKFTHSDCDEDRERGKIVFIKNDSGEGDRLCYCRRSKSGEYFYHCF
jgi:hypothetical protein